MNRQICDVCKTQDASKSYKVKESHVMHGSWEGIWEPYKKIDICDKCAEKILHMESLGSRMRDSLRRQKEINIKCGLEKREIKQGDIVQYFKRETINTASSPNEYLYKILCIAKHTEKDEYMVVYQALYGQFEIYARPYDMFMSEVDHEKYPDIKQKYRFEKWNGE